MGKTITTYLIDGTPQGPLMVYVSNKNCMAIVVPRSKMADILNRKELQKYTLYILLGESDEGEPKAYIGETNNFSVGAKGFYILPYGVGTYSWLSFQRYSASCRTVPHI